jgi:hypothetical protein
MIIATSLPTLRKSVMAKVQLSKKRVHRGAHLVVGSPAGRPLHAGRVPADALGNPFVCPPSLLPFPDTLLASLKGQGF